MALNTAKLQNRLKELESGRKTIDFNKLLWKPEEGPQKIRIVPYRPKGVEQDTPFIELKFYYKFAGIAAILAPSTFGKPDPFQERYDKLMEAGTDDEKALAKEHFSAVSRTYVPIIVRGKESEGVKFWGFGVQVYKQLLSFCNDEWGDITSLTDGNDIEVKFTKRGQKIDKRTGTPFPETTIIPTPKKTLAVSPSNKEAMDSIKTQLDIKDVFMLKSYDELNEIIEKWLNPESQPSAEEAERASSKVDANVDKTETTAPTTAPTSATPVPTTEESSEDFAKFFAK